jgi:hypothetical protein
MNASHKLRDRKCLLEGNETRRVCSTDTGTTVLDGLAVDEVSISIAMFELRSRGATYYEIENSAR